MADYYSFIIITYKTDNQDLNIYFLKRVGQTKIYIYTLFIYTNKTKPLKCLKLTLSSRQLK